MFHGKDCLHHYSKMPTFNLADSNMARQERNGNNLLNLVLFFEKQRCGQA
jgi:hypothetical protein